MLRRTILTGAISTLVAAAMRPALATPGFGRNKSAATTEDVDKALEWLQSHYRDIADALNLTANQVPLWNDYVTVHQQAVREHLLWLTQHPLRRGLDRQKRTDYWIELLELRAKLLKRVNAARAPLVAKLTETQIRQLDRFEPHGGIAASISAGPVVGPKGQHPGMMQQFSGL